MYQLQRQLALGFLLSVLLTAIAGTPAIASKTSPRRGDCYMYTNVDISPIAATKDSVSCSAIHNQETYRVGNWPSTRNPYAMTDAQRVKLAQSLCLPFKGQSEYFNYFNFYLPTRKQWNSGLHWIRCDAAIKVNEGSPNQWESWRGLILDIR